MSLENLKKLSLLVISICLSSIQSFSAPKNSLVVAIVQEWDVIHPYLLATFPAQIILQALMKPLVYYDKNVVLQPELIEKVPTYENGLAKKEKNGKLTIEIKIKDKAKWGDGIDLTCDDLDYGHRVAVNPHVGTLDQDYFSRLEKIEWSPKAPKSCKLIFKKPTFHYNDLSSYLPLPKHLDQDAFNKYSNETDGYNKNTLYLKTRTNPGLFYGPYLIEEYKLGSHITLKRNPHYYGAPAGVEKLTIRFIPNTMSLESYFLSGEVQVTPSAIGFNFDQALRLEKKFQNEKLPFKVYFGKDQTWERLYLNTKNPILSDKRVRQALNFALDREEINSAFFQGKMEVAYNMLPSFDPNYDKSEKYKKLLKTNIQKAEKLLDEAGWKMATNGIRAKDGKKMSIVISTTTGNGTREAIQVYIVEKWKKIGVEATIKNYPARTLIGDIIHENKLDGVLLLANNTGLGEAMKSTLHSSGIPSKTNGFSGLNSSNYASPEMDRLQDELENELDPKKRKVIVTKIEDLFASDLPMIPLYFYTKNSVAADQLEGDFLTGPLGFGFESVETWKWKN